MKAYAKDAAVILAVFAITYFVQKNVMPIPVVGKYLPGGV